MNKVVFLISTQRSGTKLFQSILNTSEHIRCYGEVFHPKTDFKKQNFWYFKKNILSAEQQQQMMIPTKDNIEEILLLFLKYLKSMSKREYILCDVMYTNSKFLTPVWQEFQQIPFLFDFLLKQRIPIVHLIRRNLLESYCSSKRAKITKVYHSKDASIQNEEIKLNIDLENMSNSVRSKFEEITWHRSLFENYSNYLEIFYPDFFSDQNLTGAVKTSMEKLLNLTKIDTSPSKLVKTSPDLEKYVENYKQVIFFLNQHKVPYLIN